MVTIENGRENTGSSKYPSNFLINSIISEERGTSNIAHKKEKREGIVKNPPIAIATRI
jgi:hypothetical protein